MKFIKTIAALLARIDVSANTKVPRPVAQAQATIVIKAPLPVIWQLMAQIDRWPEWNPSVSSASLQGHLISGSMFTWKSDGITIASTLQEVLPMKGLSWHGVALGTKAFHTWTFDDTGHGVVVSTTEIFDGWLPNLLTRMMQKKLDETLPRWLTALKFAAEKRNVANSPPRKTV